MKLILPYRIFASQTSSRNLKKIYQNHVRDGSARGRDGTDPKSLEAQIDELAAQISLRLKEGEYRFGQYRQMLQSKGEGKVPRIISVPTARDRIVLKALANFLLAVFPDARGAIPQARVEAARRGVQSGRWSEYVRIDVEDFYGSVSHEHILKIMRTRIRKKSILDLVMRAIQTQTAPDGRPRKAGISSRGVPQGLAVSNVLAELVASSVDQVMLSDDLHYVRFVDDVLILCGDQDSDHVFDLAKRAFNSMGLKVHPLEIGSAKSSKGLVEDGFGYLGYVFKGDLISVRLSSVHSIEGALARHFTAYRKAVERGRDQQLAVSLCLWRVNLAITGCVFDGVSRGWLHYFRQMNDLTMLKELDWTLGKFAQRFEFPATRELRSFMRAYWEIRRTSTSVSRYIPNFDEWSTVQMRRHLEAICGVDVRGWSASRVSIEFMSRVRRDVASLEVDIGLDY